MKMSLALFLLVAACFAAYAQQPAPAPAQPPSPRMDSVAPENGKAGDVLAVAGANLQKEVVAKLYLTDGKNDIVCEVVEQTDKTIKFKIPAKATGRLALMMLTAGKEPRLIEQPVKVTVE